MNFSFKEINANTFQDFVIKANYNTFLQSLGWQHFNQLLKTTTWLFGLYKNQNLISVSLVLKIQAKRGTFLFLPHSPIFKDFGQEITSDQFRGYGELLNQWKNYLKNLAIEQKCSFVRFQPIVFKNIDVQKVFLEAGFRKAPLHMHTELSTNVDLIPDFEQILLNMRKTTRQMIKKAEKMLAQKEVQVEEFNELSDELYEVYKSTYTRGNFVPYSKDYLQKEYQAFKLKEKVRLYGVRYQGELISWGMVLIFGKRAFYHHGANILSKVVPNSYLIQWEGIKFAKSLGCISYDFWGVAPKDQTNHPWANISLFKRGFGTTDTQLLEAQDLIISPFYWINWIIETIRAKKRGFE
jgi:lipid II:glycine glycyltransferase (peptidoglycan interpeptide bridge formation enzyme)